MPDAVTLAAGSCLPLVPVSPSLCGQMPDAVMRLPLASRCLPRSLRSDARCCDAGSGWCLPLVSLSPSLCGQMPDAVTPGSCLPLVSLSPSLSIQRPDAVTLAAGPCLPLVSLCLSRFLRSDARCCDAGCGVVSPACFAVSPSLCGQMLDVVSPACLPVSPSLCSAVRCRVSRLSPCLPVSHSKARCCDAGCGQGLCGQMPDAVTLAAGSCLPLVFLCLPVSAVRRQML